MATTQAPPNWKSFEVCEVDDDQQIKERPVTDAVARQGKQVAKKVLKKMKLLEDHGGPEKGRVSMKDDHGSPLVVKKSGDIWLLKCKPSCWRLYFYVEENTNRIIYTHGRCKQKDEEDPQDEAKAQRVADSIKSDKSYITEIQFPNR